MSNTRLPLTLARSEFPNVIDSAIGTHERFDITRYGARVVVLLSADDYDSLLEQLELLSNSDAYRT